MKFFFHFFLFQLAFGSFAQTCDTIEGRIINCVDTHGLKQGLWENWVYVLRQEDDYKRDRHRIHVHTDFKIELRKKVRIGMSSTGNYSDNKKTGTWRYYIIDKHLKNLEKEITYHNGRSIKEKNFIDNSEVVFDVDSMIFSGYVFRNNYKIILRCIKGKCLVRLPNGKKVLKFKCVDFTKFEFESFRLKIGEYDREIKRAVKENLS